MNNRVGESYNNYSISIQESRAVTRKPRDAAGHSKSHVWFGVGGKAKYTKLYYIIMLACQCQVFDDA